MEIFILVLQIIGIILAVIAGLIAFAAITPFTYRANADFHGSLNGEVKAAWLLNLIRIRVNIKNNKPKFFVKVLFFTVLDSTKKRKKRRKRKKKNNTNLASVKKSPKKSKAKDSEKNKLNSVETDTYNKQEKGKASNILYKIKAFFKSLPEKIKVLSKWTDEEHRQLLFFLWENGVKILKKTKPKQFKLYVKGGTGDPYYTGMISGWSGLLIGMSGVPGIQFEPDFENKSLEADIKARGGFFVVPVAWTAFKIYRNKNFKRFILKKNIPGEEK